MKLTEIEISAMIDQIQSDAEPISAEARNTLHACRSGHPLGKGRDRTDLFRDAAFVLSHRSSVSSRHVEWLNKTANQFHDIRS